MHDLVLSGQLLWLLLLFSCRDEHFFVVVFIMIMTHQWLHVITLEIFNELRNLQFNGVVFLFSPGLPKAVT